MQLKRKDHAEHVLTKKIDIENDSGKKCDVILSTLHHSYKMTLLHIFATIFLCIVVFFHYFLCEVMLLGAFNKTFRIIDTSLHMR